MTKRAKVGLAIFYIFLPVVVIIAVIGGLIMYIRYGDD